MDDRHPKRRKDKYNPYTLSMIDGNVIYLSGTARAYHTGWNWM